MAIYTLTLDDEADAALEALTEQLNLVRASSRTLAGDPLPALTPLEALQSRIEQGLEGTKRRIRVATNVLEAMLLPLTPAQRVALIQRIESPAIRRRIIDLLRDR